jgi:hypothetical protein
VVGGGDDDCVNIFSVEEAAIISICVGPGSRLLQGLFEVRLIDIAYGRYLDIRELAENAH